MDKNSKIILPGGAGLVGQNLIVLLKQRGYHNLVVLDKHETNLATLKKLHPDLQIESVDLAEKGDWQSHFSGADVVVMLQAQIGDPSLQPFLRNNITATENIIEAIKTNQVPYTVHVSSSVVESVAEDYYTSTKRQQEKMVLDSGINCVVLRPTLMFGLFDRKHLGWLSRFMNKVPIFPVPGHGNYLRQPLYARDFCNIIISCIESRIHNQIFNITGLEQITYIDIIRRIKKITGAKCHVVRIPYVVFYWLLKAWSLFDKNPPFTPEQLQALTAGDKFEVIDWPRIFNVAPVSFDRALEQTFKHPLYSKIILEF